MQKKIFPVIILIISYIHAVPTNKTNIYVDFNKAVLADVIKELSWKTKANIKIDPRVDLQTLISITVRDMDFELFLEKLCAEHRPLCYIKENNSIVFTYTYDIRIYQLYLPLKPMNHKFIETPKNMNLLKKIQEETAILDMTNNTFEEFIEFFEMSTGTIMIIDDSIDLLYKRNFPINFRIGESSYQTVFDDFSQQYQVNYCIFDGTIAWYATPHNHVFSISDILQYISHAEFLQQLQQQCGLIDKDCTLQNGKLTIGNGEHFRVVNWFLECLRFHIQVRKYNSIIDDLPFSCLNENISVASKHKYIIEIYREIMWKTGEKIVIEDRDIIYKRVKINLQKISIENLCRLISHEDKEVIYRKEGSTIFLSSCYNKRNRDIYRPQKPALSYFLSNQQQSLYNKLETIHVKLEGSNYTIQQMVTALESQSHIPMIIDDSIETQYSEKKPVININSRAMTLKEALEKIYLFGYGYRIIEDQIFIYAMLPQYKFNVYTPTSFEQFLSDLKKFCNIPEQYPVKLDRGYLYVAYEENIVRLVEWFVEKNRFEYHVERFDMYRRK